MNTDQMNHYKQRLAFETDAWDVHEALSGGEPVVVADGRSAETYAREHIPGTVNLPHRRAGPFLDRVRGCYGEYCVRCT